MQIAKWGNSLAVRLPAQLVKALNLREGDVINITVRGARDFEVERDDAQQQAREEAWKALREMARPLPPGWKFSREEIYDERVEELTRRREPAQKSR